MFNKVHGLLVVEHEPQFSSATPGSFLRHPRSAALHVCLVIWCLEKMVRGEKGEFFLKDRNIFCRIYVASAFYKVRANSAPKRWTDPRQKATVFDTSFITVLERILTRLSLDPVH